MGRVVKWEITRFLQNISRNLPQAFLNKSMFAPFFSHNLLTLREIWGDLPLFKSPGDNPRDGATGAGDVGRICGVDTGNYNNERSPKMSDIFSNKFNRGAEIPRGQKQGRKNTEGEGFHPGTWGMQPQLNIRIFCKKSSRKILHVKCSRYH